MSLVIPPPYAVVITINSIEIESRLVLISQVSEICILIRNISFHTSF
jgi:hypothetical protein